MTTKSRRPSRGMTTKFPRPPRGMTVKALHDALIALANRYDIIDVGSTIAWRSKRLDTIEAVMHELVHGVCLGDPGLSGDIEANLPRDHEGRDAQELMTLRVECHVFELLELPLPRFKARQLLAAANFDIRTPEIARFEAPLSDEEQQLAQQVVFLIKTALTS